MDRRRIDQYDRCGCNNVNIMSRTVGLWQMAAGIGSN